MVTLPLLKCYRIAIKALPPTYCDMKNTKWVSLESNRPTHETAELLLFLVCYFTQPSIEEVFRHAARYSGRLSFGVFLVTFGLYAFGQPKTLTQQRTTRLWLLLFAVLHIIHFGFLATNVVLNKIPIVPIKLTGGALAYLMIVAAPFVLHRAKKWAQLVYFYYVSAVMAITYVARAKGDFEGAEPFWFHFVALGIMITAMGFFGFKIWKAKA